MRDYVMSFMVGAIAVLTLCAIYLQVRDCARWRADWAAAATDSDRIQVLGRRPGSCGPGRSL